MMSILKAALLPLLFCAGLFAQTCTIGSLGPLYQTNQPVQLTATLNSMPSAYKLIWSVDYQRWATGYNADQHPTFQDSRDVWQGPFTVTWVTGLNGDGIHTVSGIVYDIYGNQLATCAPVTFTVRLEGMSNQSQTSTPTTGNSTSLTVQDFDGADNPMASLDGVIFDSAGILVTDNLGNIFSSGWTLNTTSVWQIPDTVTPTNVFFNIGTALSHVASIALVSTTPSSWFWASNVLYVHSANTQPGVGCFDYPAFQGISGGFKTQDFDTTCWPNGQHLFVTGWNTQTSVTYDPYVLSNTFTVSGNNIEATNHFSGQGTIVTFTTTGTLPAPLVAGSQWYWATSTTNPSNTATLSITGSPAVMTVTCHSACGVSANTPVYLRNIRITDPVSGLDPCDGYYLAASGSGTSFTVTAPSNCPAGTAASNEFEMDVNPYFVNYVDSGQFTVSATPGGSPITITNAGTGTNTVWQRIRSPYWGGNVDKVVGGGPANVYTQATFSNMNAPMEIEVPFWEIHLVAGGSTVSVCPKIKNTDLSFSTPACTAFAYTLVPDGGMTGVASVDSSGNVSGLMAGWAQVSVACNQCAAGGVSKAPVTVYVQVHSGSVTFPHFTHSGTMATSYTPGQSFFPLSAWELGAQYATNFGGTSIPGLHPVYYGPMMQEANLNSTIITADPSGIMGDPQSTSCYASSWPSSLHTFEHNFAVQYGTYFEVDIQSTQWGPGGNWLPGFLNNQGFDRKGCFTGFLSNLVSEGRTWRSVGFDELNVALAGSAPFRNPNLGSTDFPTVVVSSGNATYNVQETFQGVWSQSGGTGSWIKMAGAVTNTCLNGWFPVTGITQDPNEGAWLVSTHFTTKSPCADGTYTESSTQLYHYYIADGLSENTTVLPREFGKGNDNDNITSQAWDSTFFTQIVVSSGVAEFYMHANAISVGDAIRVHGSASGHNLNTVKPIAIIDADHFTITYNSAVENVPADGTYTSSTDPSLFVTVDGNPPPTPELSLRNVITSVTGYPATTWCPLGSSFSKGNPAVYGWAGNPAGSDAACDYVPNSPPAIYGQDSSVYAWGTYSQSTSGLATRAYQLSAREMLWGAGLSYKTPYPTFIFNPVTMKPTQLYWRPETLVAQMMGMLALNISALRLYNFDGNTNLEFAACCGWSTPSIGADTGITPSVSPKQWNAMAHVDALIHLRETTELQPNANKPYYGPMFLTDAHTSAQYGNELKILCLSEVPYGSFAVTLPTISGGTVLKYVLDGYTLNVTQLSGTPTTDTDEFCSSPGKVTVYVAQPPSVNVMANRTFAPPSTLPFGASKFLVQVGYYPRWMQDDPVTDCTSKCTIALDYHNTNVYYRLIYADSNSLPKSFSDPIKIAATGP